MSLDIARADTICALSSAHGVAAIALVRVSGSRSHDILQTVFTRHRGEIKPFVAMHGGIFDRQGRAIDDVMAIYFPENKSFTGESSFEIHCHGNPLIVDHILQILCDCGARLAEPGEFSMRALLNNKIDLAQAESIADLIHAQSDAAKKAALLGLRGALADKTKQIRESLVSMLAEIEARMDFPDEDLGSYDRQALIDQLQSAQTILSEMLSNAQQALRLQNGVRIVICGLPNAGKSTLLNRLCGEDRAIVHESAGTTRDVVEAQMILEGVPVTLVDVAGIREVSHDGAVEKIGIQRAWKEIEHAHLILWLADCTRAEPFSDQIIASQLERITTPVIRVLNKTELQHTQNCEVLAISAKTGQGIEKLLGEIKQRVLGSLEAPSQVFFTRARQRDELHCALQGIQEAIDALHKKMVDEVIASELRSAGAAFDRLFGTTLSEDILDKIFSQFCIGK